MKAFISKPQMNETVMCSKQLFMSYFPGDVELRSTQRQTPRVIKRGRNSVQLLLLYIKGYLS